MLKKVIGLSVVLSVAAVVAWGYCPGLRTKIKQAWNDQTGWTAEARAADPVGFIEYAEGKMKEDLAKMQKNRRELAAEASKLAQKVREQKAMATQAQAMAEEFRAEYQKAKANNSFPIEVRGRAYTETQVRSQVSLLLAEAESYGQSLSKIEAVQAEAEQKMEDLAIRIGKTEPQIAVLATQRELLRVRELTTEGETLLAQVDELMTGNTQAIADTPIRTVRELVAAEQVKPQGRATNRKVADFLAAKPKAKPVSQVADSFLETTVEESSIEVKPVSYSEEPDADEESAPSKQKPSKKQEPTQQKPIFQQS